LEESDVDGRKILTRIFRKCDGGLVWINLAQNRDWWQDIVGAVTNFRVP